MSYSTRQAGVTGIVLFLLCAILLLSFILGGDFYSRMLGGAAAPLDAGPAPVEVPMPDLKLAPLSAGSILPELSTDALRFQPEDSDSTRPEDTPALPERPEQTHDDSQASGLLAHLESAYRDFDWQGVHRLANQVLDMDVSPQLKTTARSRMRSARLVERFMNDLDSDRYGMSRNIATHPALVQLTLDNGHTIEVVPVRSLTDLSILPSEDPVAFVERLLASGQAIPLMDTSRIPSTYRQGKVQSVAAADPAGERQTRAAELRQRLGKLENSVAARDPLALYEAARFAYANRVDEVVTGLLDRALLLNPALAEQIKEDEAQEYFEKMVSQIEKGRKTTAAGFLASLKKNFSDTNVYKQARAYYDGDAKAALAAAEAAKRRIRDARRREFEERKQLAQKSGDTQTVERLEQTQQAIESEEAAEEDFSQVNGDQAQADEWLSKGKDLYFAAIDAGNSSKRDDLYGEAEGWLRKALAIYAKLVDDGQDQLASTMVRCNQLIYACRKQRRF